MKNKRTKNLRYDVEQGSDDYDSTPAPSKQIKRENQPLLNYDPNDEDFLSLV